MAVATLWLIVPTLKEPVPALLIQIFGWLPVKLIAAAVLTNSACPALPISLPLQ